MDKNAIKKYAVWARNELIARVSQKAQQYGITVEGYGDKNADSINGVLLSATEKKQRQALIAKIDAEGFEQVMEEVAYTWFNRFIALRFMEVNNYLPSHTRVFTNEANEFKPQILADAISLEIEGLDMDRVFELKDANKDEELYKYLLIVQCNALSSILPGMFQKIADYTELLLPDYLLRDGSIIDELIKSISEADWNDQVQIIGWLYQYYNSEPKDAVFAAMKKNIKVTKENIPAATQLFTPDWIVRYMVENSLGRLWFESNKQTALTNQWNYFQMPEIQEDDVNETVKAKEMSPEEIRCIDPCSGSGHILCYFFDVLIQIYEEYGYTAREAVEKIVANNLWGLDIDERAAQLAYFSIMMKARQYDRRFFSRNIQPHICPVRESNSINRSSLSRLGDNEAVAIKLLDNFKDAKEYGSMLVINEDLEKLLQLKTQICEIADAAHEDLFAMLESQELVNGLGHIVDVAIALKQKYDVVVTNPPYMSNRNMGKKTAAYIAQNYPDCKNDTFAAFIDVAAALTKGTGMYAMITQPSIISLSAFKHLRYKMITEQSFVSLIHMGRGIFGVDFGSAAFVVRKKHIENYTARYMKLFKRTFQYIDPEDIARIYLNAKDDMNYYFDFSSYKTNTNEQDEDLDMENEDEVGNEGVEEPISYLVKQEAFLEIPDNPFAYWMAPELIRAFGEKSISDYATVTNGLFTCDNNRFLRMWHELNCSDIFFDCNNKEENIADTRKWYPYNKGGNYRKWYGNHEYVVNFRHFGREISDYRVKSGQSASFPGQDYYFRPSLSWSFISAAKFGIRYYPKGFVFDIAGSSVFANMEDDMYKLLGFLGSEVAVYALQIMNPTMNYQAGNVRQLPLLQPVLENEDIGILAKENVSYAKEDWDSFERSWNFRKHPLIRNTTTVAEAFVEWEKEAAERFYSVKRNEERINDIIVGLYRLGDYINTAVDEKYITVSKADLQRDIKSLISYAVGCMFGRYSIEKEGLIFAGGSEITEYGSKFVIDKDNIIPISDDEYFEDDIVGLFVKFIEAVYGKANLEENLDFIAKALGGKGTSREIIRSYFINDFYADHVKEYQKRPMYWLFDSGKKNGFKCLIYMHRYQPDTIARIRTDYVHEQQSRYRTAITDLENRVANATTSERVKMNKQLKTIKDQAEEIRKYEEKIHHLADQMISIDLDEGVKVNYEKFKDVLAKIK